MIYIHKGDDTNFENEQFLTFNIQSNYDMSNWMCIVSLCGVIKTVRDLSVGTFQLNYSNQDTKLLQYGIHYFNIKVVDGEGRIKTISNSVPVEITNKIVQNQEQVISLEALPVNDTQINIVVSGGGGGAGGTTNHALLSNLSYAQSGHIGFASSDDISNLQLQISNKQPIGDYALNSQIPTQTNQLTNNSGFITNAVSDLINYYTNSEVYTKDEIIDLISGFTSLKIEIVEQLPAENISTSTFYLVPVENPSGDNYYNEYLYIGNRFELIGTTSVDLTNYVKNTDYAVPNGKSGVVKIDPANGINITNQGKLYIQGANNATIANKTVNYQALTPSTLDFATKIGITTNLIELTNTEKTAAKNWLGINQGVFVGMTFFSVSPILSNSLHVLNGSLLEIGGIYDDFITNYIVPLSISNPECFLTESQWQTQVSLNGVCGKFVYTQGESVRLPKFGTKNYTYLINSSAAVIGNGIAPQFTDGNVYGVLMNTTFSNEDYRTQFLTFRGNSSTYDDIEPVAVGTTLTNSGKGASNTNFATGFSTDPTKSGLIANTENLITGIDGYWYMVIRT